MCPLKSQINYKCTWRSSYSLQSDANFACAEWRSWNPGTRNPATMRAADAAIADQSDCGEQIECGDAISL